ncbi:MAG TPA: lysophospholipid acyltransferase family protein [Candidatus Limnocylindria bacterium]|nr:lysophospholipid acyltransferase family protein [Candidatus Limnocylindria bacterium]
MGARDLSRRTAPWWMGLAAWAATAALLVLGRTWRIVWVNLAGRDAALARDERCIFALWHAHLLPLVFTHRRRAVAVLISRHRDGELIARVVERFGYVTARGSSTRGGEEGVREMLAQAEAGHLLAITPDGPRGPAERVKPGLIYLASRTGFPILPVAAGARPVWALRSWDRFRIPRPFARVVVAYGEPIAIPSELDDAGAEQWRAAVERAIAAITNTARVQAGERA